MADADAASGGEGREVGRMERSEGRRSLAINAWRGVKPYGKAALYGAAFVGGGLLLAELLGPRTARRLGYQGGEGFARGVAELNAQIDRVRGDRFG